MKEIRMDWESYQSEKREIKDEATEFALMQVARWLEGKDTLKSCLYYEESRNKYLIRIAEALGRENELKEEVKLVKNEVAA